MTKFRTLLIFILIALPLSAAQPIIFRGGHTKAVMREGRETIMLSQDAVVEVGSVKFEAENIELLGPDSRYLVGTGGVFITDSDNNILIKSNTLSYDRVAEKLLVDGWAEVQDLENEIIATGAYLSYSRNESHLLLQIEAKILRHTDSGIMVCRADSIEYNRVAQTLHLIGNTTISYKGDTYSASGATVDLENDEILLEGSIRGSVNG